MTKSSFVGVYVPRPLFFALKPSYGWKGTKQKGRVIKVTVTQSEASQIRDQVKLYRLALKRYETIAAQQIAAA